MSKLQRLSDDVEKSAMGLFSKFKLPTEEHGLSPKDRQIKSLQSMVLALLEVIQVRSYGPSSQESRKLQETVEEASRLVLTDHTTPRQLAEARENVARYARLSADCQQQLMDDMGREMANATNDLVENITDSVNKQMGINGQIEEAIEELESLMTDSTDPELKQSILHLKGLINLQAGGCQRVAEEFERAGSYANRRAQMRGTASHTDPVTGLANQTALENSFDLLSRQSRTGGVSVRIALIDLDLARQMPSDNEEAVKTVLRMAAKQIALQTPAILYLGRLNQDAFLLIGGVNEVEWSEILAKIERTIQKTPFGLAETSVHIRPFTAYADQEDHEPFAACLEKALKLSYEAKKKAKEEPKKQIPA